MSVSIAGWAAVPYMSVLCCDRCSSFHDRPFPDEFQSASRRKSYINGRGAWMRAENGGKSCVYISQNYKFLSGKGGHDFFYFRDI